MFHLISLASVCIFPDISFHIPRHTKSLSLCQLTGQMCPSSPVPSLFQLCVVAVCCLCSRTRVRDRESLVRRNLHLASVTSFPGLGKFLFGNLGKIFSGRLRTLWDLCNVFFFFFPDWQRQTFLPTQKCSVKTQHHPWTLKGSWWRDVICLIFSTTKSCWQQNSCYVFYLFPTQQLNTTDGRICLLSIDPGDPV